MGVVAGAILPHAPALHVRADLGSLRDSAHEAIARLTDVAVLIVLSPHGPMTGVHESVRGSLDGFGASGYDLVTPTDPELAQRLAQAWTKPVLDGPVDHGVTGALVGAASLPPVVVCTFTETTGPDAQGAVSQVRKDALALAEELEALDVDVGLLASAHGAAALTPRAPLGERAAAQDFEFELTSRLAEDPVRVCELDDAAWMESGSCGAGPLTTFGAVFAGRPARVDAHEHPFGVGYLVARV